MFTRITYSSVFQILTLLMCALRYASTSEDTTSNETLSNETLSNETVYNCLGPSKEDMKLYGKLAWWMDGVVQVIVGTVGMAGNFVAIPILMSKRMASIFNRILVCLAAFDNVFIFCSLLEAVRKNFGPLHDVAHVYAFAYFLYQLQSVAIVSSIFTTVVLALERCLAVAKPIEYHNAVQGTNPWRRVTNYIVPVVIFSAVFNIPKCFETAVVEQITQEKRLDAETNTTEFINKTVVGVFPTDLRMDIDYVFFYNNLAKLLITGVIPFVALCIFNFKIYAALRRRRQMMGPAAAAAHAQQLNEDNRQALVLFGIVIIFLACNIPRVVLNFHEVFTIQKYKEALAHNCYSLPLWVLFMGNFSQLSMIINSSINFFIYCFMSSVFREVLHETFFKCCKSMGCSKDGPVVKFFRHCWHLGRRRPNGTTCLNATINNNADLQHTGRQLRAGELELVAVHRLTQETKRNGADSIEVRPLINEKEKSCGKFQPSMFSKETAVGRPRIEVVCPSEYSNSSPNDHPGKSMEHIIRGSLSTTEITYV